MEVDNRVPSDDFSAFVGTKMLLNNKKKLSFDIFENR
jgi:hypothetical protein